MAKTVKEALEQISAKIGTDGEKKLNRFSRKSFDTFLQALINDPDFATDIVKVEKGQITGTESVKITAAFREWLKKVLEQAGVDKAESGIVLTKEFEINSVKGLYDFFTNAIYLYMQAGNYFAFPDRADFHGSIYLKDNDEQVIEKEAKNPRTGEILGKYQTTKKAHVTVAAKSSCPAWLKVRKEI